MGIQITRIHTPHIRTPPIKIVVCCERLFVISVTNRMICIFRLKKVFCRSDQNSKPIAAMAELADAQDSGSCVRKDVLVRLQLAA